jgi:hypothetical protein
MRDRSRFMMLLPAPVAEAGGRADAVWRHYPEASAIPVYAESKHDQSTRRRHLR